MCARAHVRKCGGRKAETTSSLGPPLPAHGRVRGSAFVCGTLSLSLMAKLILASRQLECSKKKKKKRRFLEGEKKSQGLHQECANRDLTKVLGARGRASRRWWRGRRPGGACSWLCGRTGARGRSRGGVEDEVAIERHPRAFGRPAELARADAVGGGQLPACHAVLLCWSPCRPRSGERP